MEDIFFVPFKTDSLSVNHKSNLNRVFHLQSSPNLYHKNVIIEDNPKKVDEKWTHWLCCAFTTGCITEFGRLMARAIWNLF
ncbi:unnamed protein product [Bursaphelenchus okinawaensis]|uniref:Uncharacterized protein n=1 Tax=Bursaphelenchus okinawaensis TaxID=465554 RepID=A0A811L8L8_9BILA|nr:unnamed protein product [Bursaphelenchus okinawaensis]CAG9119283.1 unnamed protein product [Bursaphelenchus okinawaensis]